jgi:hypothetical protein
VLRRVAAVALLAGSSALPAFAQLPEVQQGSRIRLRVAGVVAGNYEGILLTRTPDTLVVGGPSSAPVHIPVARITSLEISRGTSRAAGAMVGVKWGIPITTALGAVLIAAAASDDGCGTCSPVSVADDVGVIAIAAFTGAFYGASIGALIGRERWENFELTPRTSLDGRRGRIGISLGF